MTTEAGTTRSKLGIEDYQHRGAVEKVVSTAPPLTPAQISALSVLLRSGQVSS